MTKAETKCLISYETLKFNARHKSFRFSSSYDTITAELRSQLNSVDVSRHWPTKVRAESTIKSIRKKYVNNNSTRVAKAKDLTLSDDMKNIIINGQEQLFLQYDNECKNGNRILIFYSDQGTEILKASESAGCDGTFKYSPKIFYQIFTIIGIYKGDSLPCIFILLEKKEYETYLEALNEIRRNLFESYAITLDNLTIMLDFELAMQQALRQTFKNTVIIKGCWFHFCQAILTNVGSIGFKQDYQNSYEVRFWIKRFMALALIPLYRIEDAVAIIINEIDPDEKIFDKKVEFLQYFADQWLNAKMSKQGPEIWNQHLATIRTNNGSENNHSIQSSTIPRHHGLVSYYYYYYYLF